jgi:hypothetical protein
MAEAADRMQHRGAGNEKPRVHWKGVYVWVVLEGESWGAGRKHVAFGRKSKRVESRCIARGPQQGRLRPHPPKPLFHPIIPQPVPHRTILRVGEASRRAQESRPHRTRSEAQNHPLAPPSPLPHRCRWCVHTQVRKQLLMLSMYMHEACTKARWVQGAGGR